MNNVEVVFSHHDEDNCRTYYRTLPNNQLVCLQEETANTSIWYTCIDDDCWNEPEYPINTDLNNMIIKEMSDE